MIEIKIFQYAVDIVRGLEKALKRGARFEAAKINASVIGGTAKLEGPVQSWSECDASLASGRRLTCELSKTTIRLDDPSTASQ